MSRNLGIFISVNIHVFIYLLHAPREIMASCIKFKLPYTQAFEGYMGVTVTISNSLTDALKYRFCDAVSISDETNGQISLDPCEYKLISDEATIRLYFTLMTLCL